MTNIAIIKDAVIVLFLNSMDEQFFRIVNLLNPYWIDEMENEINSYFLHMASNESSEVIDIEFSPNDEGENVSTCSNHFLDEPTRKENRYEMSVKGFSKQLDILTKSNKAEKSERK